MSLAFSQTPFRRINPHPGMMIDVDTWRDAHDYHRDQLNLHHLALHGWGVIQGLDVHLVDGADNTLRIEPGLAIDSAGRFVIVPQPQMYQITARERQTVYLVLQFRDVLAAPPGAVPTRVVEAYRIQERDRLPEEPYLELARVDFDPKAGPVKLARHADSPGKNELDLRSRAQLGSLAATPSPTPTPLLVAADDADGLAPRLDGLSQQLDTLAQQVQVLSNEVQAVRVAPAAETGGQDAGAGPSQDGRESAAPGTPPAAAAAAESTGPALSAEQVSGVVAEQVSGVRDRLESVIGRLENLSMLVTAAGQREAVDVEGLGARLDGLRHEVDALGVQVQSLSRQVDGLPLAPLAPVAVVTPVAAVSQAGLGTPGAAGRVGRGVLRLAIAEHGASGWDTHRDGLGFLARELSASTDVDGQVIGTVRIAEASGIDVLYMSGHAALSLADAEVEGIRRLLDDGLAVVGEGCPTGPNGEAGAREFAMSFVDLANRLGRQLTRVDRNHALMRARHIFGELPPGGRATARVLESGGLVYSDADYGCAWQGGSAERALPRSAIRDALDFGINLALFRRNGH